MGFFILVRWYYFDVFFFVNDVFVYDFVMNFFWVFEDVYDLVGGNFKFC